MKLKIDIIGLILIAIGTIMLFNYLGYTDIRVMDILFSYWPLILIYIGIKMLFNKTGKAEIIIGGGLCFIGLGILGENLNVFRFDLGYFIGLLWPVGMIFIGLSLMYKSKPKNNMKNKSVLNKHDSEINSNNSDIHYATSNIEGNKSKIKVNLSKDNEDIKVNLSKDDRNTNYTSFENQRSNKAFENSHEKLWDLKDGSYTAFMGGVELDISKARFLEDEVNINLTAVMGGIEILVPRDITIHCKGTAVLGGLEFIGKESGGVFSNLTGDYIPQLESKGKIYFNCNVLMGEITINFK